MRRVKCVREYQGTNVPSISVGKFYYVLDPVQRVPFTTEGDHRFSYVTNVFEKVGNDYIFVGVFSLYYFDVCSLIEYWFSKETFDEMLSVETDVIDLGNGYYETYTNITYDHQNTALPHDAVFVCNDSWDDPKKNTKKLLTK